MKSEEVKMASNTMAAPDLLLSEGGATLRKALLMKADKMDIEKIYHMKSNKADTEIMLDCQ